MLPVGNAHLPHAYRPTHLRRSRSHSSPGQDVIQDATADNAVQPSRPSHGRSYSYLSTTEAKPRQANTLPANTATTKAESHHRIHMPGKHRDQHRSTHRYTQSAVDHKMTQKHTDAERAPNHLVAGLRAEGLKQRDSHNDGLPTVPGSLTRMMSSRSYRGGQPAAGDAYASSGQNDLRSPPQAQKKTPIELDLERADRVKRRRKLTVTKEVLMAKDKEIEEAEEEMRERVADINHTGLEITRRLDYGYYNLLEKVGNLVATIHSFQQLAAQSKQLVRNFEVETGKVDEDMVRRISGFQETFGEREERVAGLAGRGDKTREKAEDLGRRLDNARIMVENWERREEEARKVWGRFWGMVWWTVGVVMVVVVSVVMAKEWWFRGDPVKAGMGTPAGGHPNRSLALGDGGKGERMLASVDLPEDVRVILQDIQQNNKKRKNFIVRPAQVRDEHDMEEQVEDRRLRRLDEL